MLGGRLFLLCLLLTLAGAGCAGGGDAASFPAPTTLPAPPVQGTLVGRLFLGRPVPASVTVEALDGSRLGEVRVGEGGFFALRNASLPADFRVVARLEGSTQEFAQEVRGYKGGNLYVAPNVPTTLASLYVRANGGSLEEAEARVRRGLNLPVQTSLAYGVEETPRASFSHVAFFRAAGLAGGWEPFSQEMVRRLQTGATSSFVLTRSELSRPLTGLEAGLQARMERIRTWLQSYIVFSDGVDLGLPRQGSHRSILARGLFGDAGLGIATGMIGNWLTVGFTAAANAMGWNTGTAAQLQDIEETLSLIQSEVTALNVTVSQLALGTDVQNLQESAINPIIVATNSIQEALAQVGTSQNLPNVPFTPSSQVAAMLGQVGNYTTNVNLDDIQEAMLGSGGSTNLILTTQNLTVPIYGFDQPASMMSFPYRFNNLLATATQTYSLYEGYQLEALNLLAEFAHNSPDPATAVNSNLDTLINATLSLKAQRQQQPVPLPSDSVILDLEYGLMWYNGVSAPSTYDVALSVADSFSVQGTLIDGTTINYDDWRLPTSAEIQALQNRGAYNPKKQGDPDGTVPTASDDAYPDFGQVTSGLPQLGFVGVANAFNEANSVGSNNPGNDGDVWIQYWESGDGGTFFDETYQFFSLNQTKRNINGASSSDLAPFLLVRTVSQPLMNPLGQYIDVEGDTVYPNPSDPPPTTVPSPVIGTPLVPAEYIHYGTITSVQAPTAAPAVAVRPSPYPAVPSGALQLSSQVTGTLTMGGTFSQGANGTSVSQTVQSLSQVGSPTSTTTTAGTPSDLARLISFVPQQSSASAIIWNSEGLDGLAILRQGSSLGVAAAYGSLSSTATVAGTLTPGTMTALAISPRNQQYLTFPSTPILYYCTGFCSNMTVLSQGNNVTWNLSPNNLGLSVGTTGQNSAQILGQPALQPSPTLQTFTLTASLAGLTDQTQFQVQMPVGTPSPSPGAPGPVINTLTPAFGSAAGGTPVRISGTGFTGVTNVTFGGTQAQFSVDTNTQITVFGTPPGPAGTVVVTVTSPDGAGTANYTYTQ